MKQLFLLSVEKKKTTDNAFLMEENYLLILLVGNLILKKGEKGRVHYILPRWDHILQVQL